MLTGGASAHSPSTVTACLGRPAGRHVRRVSSVVDEGEEMDVSSPRHGFRTRRVANPILGIVLVVSGLSALGTRSAAAAWQDSDLRIVVLEGEDSVNIIGQGTAVPTVVEVRDRNDLPVSGASVLFLLGEGGTATLNAGLSQVAVTTNALGQAAVTVNPLASGAVQLQVSAAFQGQTATAAIVQTNVATAAAAGGTAGGAAGTAGAGGGTGGGAGGAGGATGAAAGGGAGGGLGAGGIVGVVAGSVGAAVAGVTVARDEDPAPPVAAMRITPTGLGMAGLTEYRFDGSGSSDPNEDVLTYAWDFGDGGRGTGVKATHIYDAAGSYEVTLTVTDGSAESVSGGSVRVGPNLNGRFVGVSSWLDDRYDCGVWRIAQTLDLRQDGQSVRGSFEHFADQSSQCGSHSYYFSVSGSVTSGGNFVCPCDIRLQLQLTGHTDGPPDDRWDWRNEPMVGVVAAGADSIAFGSTTFQRQ